LDLVIAVAGENIAVFEQVHGGREILDNDSQFCLGEF
jgi:hypothetical protein